MKYKLEKSIWTQEDFEQMGWHDSRIYKIRFSKELELDIDYILKWNTPDLEGLPFTFWVVPATLVFKEVKELGFEIDAGNLLDIEIEDIKRELKDGKYFWTILTGQGDFDFESSGFVQFIRQEPFFQFGQTIPFRERNGYSLEQTTNQENPNRNRKDIVEQIEKNLEHYEDVKKRHLKKQEQKKLDEQWSKGEIISEKYLKRKKEIKGKIEFYDYSLKETIFENW